MEIPERLPDALISDAEAVKLRLVTLHLILAVKTGDWEQIGEVLDDWNGRYINGIEDVDVMQLWKLVVSLVQLAALGAEEESLRRLIKAFNLEQQRGSVGFS